MKSFTTPTNPNTDFISCPLHQRNAGWLALVLAYTHLRLSGLQSSTFPYQPQLNAL
ncbi:hypothetical protein NA644_07410 [Pseudomonas stutzeri]|uniref:hypothetical protein n=1 Tax=Stutzerimonas stutzeri TaxID=316 RepID=UPI001CA4B7B5|nr:hypothetical protein [Stutzerimonas stutzeri]MCQ4249136.1 hypothetical protein [Stutzerimonas stutzeri]